MYRQSEKNLLNISTSPTCPHNMVNFGPPAAEICWRVWGTLANFNGFRVLAALQHGTLVVGVSQTASLNRGCHVYSAGRPSRCALAHISSLGLLFMAALHSRCGHSILRLWFLLHFSSYSQQSQIGCPPYFLTWCGLSANLECNLKCAARDHWKYRMQKLCKKIAICIPSHIFVRLYLRN